jgi:hypothetical protein
LSVADVMMQLRTSSGGRMHHEAAAMIGEFYDEIPFPEVPLAAVFTQVKTSMGPLPRSVGDLIGEFYDELPFHEVPLVAVFTQVSTAMGYLPQSVCELIGEFHGDPADEHEVAASDASSDASSDSEDDIPQPPPGRRVRPRLSYEAQPPFTSLARPCLAEGTAEQLVNTLNVYYATGSGRFGPTPFPGETFIPGGSADIAEVGIQIVTIFGLNDERLLRSLFKPNVNRGRADTLYQAMYMRLLAWARAQDGVPGIHAFLTDLAKLRSIMSAPF